MFSPATQQIYQIDDSSAWTMLRALKSGADFTQLLAVDTATSDREVTVASWLVAWSNEGIVRSGESSDRIANPVDRQVRLGPLTFALRGASGSVAEQCVAPYAQAEPDADAQPARTIIIEEIGPLVAIGTAGENGKLVPREFAVCEVRSLLLKHLLSVSENPLLHCAALEAGGGLVLLVGSPGSGKSTLTLALLQHGWRFASDDLTFLEEGGKARGVPFPITIKQGSWPLAQRWLSGLADLPELQRADGQTLKYWPLVARDTAARSLSVRAVIRLDRNSDLPPDTANLANWDKVDAMAALFAEGHHPSGEADGPTVQSMAQLIEGADCAALSYSEAESAARALSDRYG